MFTVSRSRRLVASTDVAFVQWLFLSQHRVQIYCSAAGITGWEREMKGKGVITRLSTRVRLPFSTISALVPWRKAEIWRVWHCYTHSDLLLFPVHYSYIPGKSIRLKAIGGGLENLSLTVFTSEYCSRPYSPLKIKTKTLQDLEGHRLQRHLTKAFIYVTPVGFNQTTIF